MKAEEIRTHMDSAFKHMSLAANDLAWNRSNFAGELYNTLRVLCAVVDELVKREEGYAKGKTGENNV